MHSENTKAFARLLFIDFSSAFNKIVPQTLLDKLIQMEVNPFMIKMVPSFFLFSTDRTQVKMDSILSDTLTISTGVPQGC